MYLVDVPIAYPFRWKNRIYLRDECKYIPAYNSILVKCIDCKTDKVKFLYPYSDVLRVPFSKWIKLVSRFKPIKNAKC